MTTGIEGVRLSLASSRERGEPFDRAWERVNWTVGWSVALDETRDAWQRAYERGPQPEPERALGLMSGAFNNLPA